MRLKQKVLSMLICLMMCLSIMPSVVLAAHTEYNVWVGGTRITSDNMKDVLGDGGKVSYTPATGSKPAELILNGANVEAIKNSTMAKENAAIFVKEDLNIVLAEDSVNNVKSTIDSADLYGIYVDNIYNELTITGNGTLNVETGDCNGISTAIRTPRSDFKIDGGALVNATSGVSNSSFAVNAANGNLIVTNGSRLVAKSLGCNTEGISRGISLSSEKSVLIGNEGSLEARGYSLAIHAKEIDNLPGAAYAIDASNVYDGHYYSIFDLNENLLIKVFARKIIKSVNVTCDSVPEYGEYCTPPVCEFDVYPEDAAYESCKWVKLDLNSNSKYDTIIDGKHWVDVPEDSKFTPGTYRWVINVNSRYGYVFDFGDDGPEYATIATFDGKADEEISGRMGNSIYYSKEFVIEDRTLYGVEVNGKEFTSFNIEEGIPCGDGKATLDISTTPYTLTLDNAEILTNDSYGIMTDGQSLNIVLIGENSIDGQNIGIYCRDQDVTITGNGNLTVSASSMYLGSVYAKNIVFKNEGNITFYDEEDSSHSGTVVGRGSVTFAGSGNVDITSLYEPAVDATVDVIFSGKGEVSLKGYTRYNLGSAVNAGGSILLNGENSKITLGSTGESTCVTKSTVSGLNLDRYELEGSLDSDTAIYTFICEHTNQVIKNSVEPTCDKKGYSGDTYCADCDLKIKDGKAIDALGHKYGDWTTTKNPTNKVEGSKERICSVCGNKETAVIPTVAPTKAPTAVPTKAPTTKPTVVPTTAPIAKPTAVPTKTPIAKPTVVPTVVPSVKPTAVPTVKPTEVPVATTTVAPTAKPTVAPTAEPTKAPVATATPVPTAKPTATVALTATPTAVPTEDVTATPTAAPTEEPTVEPTEEPTKAPSVEDFAERLYTTCLGREAEEAGKDYWTSELKGGKTGAEVAEGFFFSPEYEGRNLNNEEFIGTLYETFMGRTPADDEVAYWSSEMENGKDRKFIFDGFVNSPEWANICLTYGIRSGGLASPTFEKEASDKVKAFAERLYTTCLGREAEKEGLEWWAAELANLRQTGTVAASGFFYSPEFLGLNTSDDEYVTRLYRTFMGREPEEAGFEFWTSELKSGKDRQYVFDGFSAAPEFADLCADAGIMR